MKFKLRKAQNKTLIPIAIYYRDTEWKY